MMTSSSAFLETTGKPENYIKEKLKILSPYASTLEDIVKYEDYQVISWGKDNRFPHAANKQITTTSVLNTGLKFLRSLTIGQGIYPQGFQMD